MTDRKYLPVRPDHVALRAKTRGRKGFSEAYDTLKLGCQIAGQLLKARARIERTQDVVAERIGTTKSAVLRLEAAGKRTWSPGTLRRYARALGCDLQVMLVPDK